MKVRVKPVAQFNQRETELIVKALVGYSRGFAQGPGQAMDEEEAAILAANITKSFDDVAGSLNAMAHNMRNGRSHDSGKKQTVDGLAWDKE